MMPKSAIRNRRATSASITELFTKLRSARSSFDFSGEPHRYVYWSDGPDGGVGVSFVDPYVIEGYDEFGDWTVSYRGHFRAASDVLAGLFKHKDRVVTIAKCDGEKLGSLLSAECLNPFAGFKANWLCTEDEHGHPYDHFLRSWTLSHKGYEYDDDGNSNYRTFVDLVVPNDYTNRSFNYLYIRKLLKNKQLIEAIAGCDFFSDGVLVDRKTGYFSPAYAVSLYKSLLDHGLLDAAMSSFESFVHYHPYDPIVAMCEANAEKRFKNIRCIYGRDPIAEELERRTFADFDDDNYDSSYDDYDSPYYVDDCPVYGADDEEDAEMIYWNTH